ncbi:type 1 glutamine amidotransferase [candidate division KSB1 bacterium]
MRIMVLQHGTVDDHVVIEDWANDMEHDFERRHLLNGDTLPGFDDFDWLIILGGLMDTHETGKYPWLANEKALIKSAIDSGKIVLGICLGAQLVAEALGAKVYQGEHKEIGWRTLKLSPEAKQSEIFGSFPEWFSAFQWHDYTFDLPEGAIRIAENDAYQNQGFEYDGGRVIGIQFHPEFTEKCIGSLVRTFADKMGEGPHVQPKEEILAERCLIREIDALIDLLLTNISDTFDK